MPENRQRTTPIEGFWIDQEINRHRYIFNNEDLAEVAAEGPNRDAAFKRLKRQALQVVELPKTDLMLLVSEKPRMYTAKTPLDVMLLVASPDRHRRKTSLWEISSLDLGYLLGYATEVLSGLKKVAEQSGEKVVHQAIAVNFHEDPLSLEDVYHLRKPHAQTLDLLHFHAVVLTERELKNNGKQLSKSEKDVAYDPLSFAIPYLMEIPSIAETFASYNLTKVNDKNLKYVLDKEADSFGLARAIISLHKGYEHNYKIISELFIDKYAKSDINMPLLDGEDSWQKIKSFIRNLRTHFLNKDVENIKQKIDKLFELLNRLNKIFKDADKEHLFNDERLFLRSPAYTMVMELSEAGEWIITLSPRLISTGNALHSLGYYKQADENNLPDKKWWEMRKKMLRMFGKFSF